MKHSPQLTNGESAKWAQTQCSDRAAIAASQRADLVRGRRTTHEAAKPGALARLLALGIMGLAFGGTAAFRVLGDSTSAAARPNFIFILIDDLGWTDLGCFGSTFYETPRIDRLAAEGMRFTNAYAACTVCSPTRAAILTGKYPARLHLTDWIPGHVRKNARLLIPDWTQYLALEEVTLAEALRPAGYVCGHVGKWHLGNESYYPQRQGFDVNIAGDRWGSPASYFWPYGTKARRVPLDGGSPGEYLTDRLTDEAIDFIRKHRDRPFFLYLAHYAVHTPLQAKPELVAKYEKKLAGGAGGEQRCAVYAAMIESVDQSVGRIVDALRQLQLDQRTVIFFTSDNGGLTLPACRGQPVTCNAPLRAGKGSAYEGGVRVPLIVWWPRTIPPGGVSHTPVISTDFYPTILQLAGLSSDPARQTDGENLVPLLRRTGSLRREAIYWHYPHYHPGGATPYGAVRAGEFRLIEFYEDGRIELYNLANDVGEKQDLSKTQPDRARSLQRLLHQWRKSVGAQMPSGNPNVDAGSPAR